MNKEVDALRFAEAYHRYASAMEEYQKIIDKVIHSNDTTLLNQLASGIECNVETMKDKVR